MTLRRLAWIVGLGVVAAVVGSCGYYAYRMEQARRDVAELAAQLDRDDPGWRFDDLEAARPAVAPEQDGAAQVFKVRGLLPARGVYVANDPIETFDGLHPRTPLAADVAEGLRSRLEALGPAVAEARKLAHTPDGRFTLRYTADVYSTLLPHVDAEHHAGLLVYLEAHRQVHAGDPARALEASRGLAHLARMLQTEPLMISQLVRATYRRQAVITAQRTLAHTVPAAADVAALQHALTTEDQPDPYRVAVRAERAAAHQFMTNVRDGRIALQPTMRILRQGHDPRPSAVRMGVEEIQMGATLPEAHAWLLHHFTDLLAVPDLPPTDRLPRLRELDARLSSAPLLARAVLMPFKQKGHAHYDRLYGSQAELRCAVTGLAAERYRLAHGRWPARLDDLCPAFLPAVPLDPFTDQPLRLRATPDGIVIYSVGVNGLNRGEHFDSSTPAPQLPGGMLEFRLWNPDLRGRPIEAAAE